MEKKDTTFAVIGCGQFGGSVVEELARQGADVLAIDNNEEVIKKYGTPVVNGVVSGFGVEETGVCTWYEGCENMDEVNAKLEKGKSIDVLVVTFANGKATKAEYSVAEPKED